MTSVFNDLMPFDGTSLSSSELKLSAIIVTYGNRWLLLCNVIHSLEKEDLVAEIVVVNNASSYDVTTACESEGFKKVTVLDQNENIGAGGGFASGISFSIEQGADLVLLLDDDNLPLLGAIKKLMSSYIQICQQYSAPVVLAAYRHCQYNNFWRLPENLMFANDDFAGFNLFNVLQRRLSHFQRLNKKKSGRDFFIQKRICPFSGLLLSSKDIKTVGLPRKDMVIYYDDVEWIIRILNSGGTIWLDTEANIEEQNSNYVVSVFEKPVIGMILADSESKVYYLIRNRTFIDKYIEKKTGFFYTINKIIFLGLLGFCSLLFGRLKRMKTVYRAFCDGSRGRLGMNSRYRLI